jgi:hypothetical protein
MITIINNHLVTPVRDITPMISPWGAWEGHWAR